MEFRKMKYSDYNKVRGVIVENCNKVSLHSKVTITKLYWTALEIPTYHVTYTYSDKTNDDQKVVLEKIRLFMKKDQVTLMAMFQNIRNRFWSRNLSKRLRRKLKNNWRNKNSVFLLVHLVFYLTSVMMKRRKIWIPYPQTISKKVRRTLQVTIKFHTKPWLIKSWLRWSFISMKR